MMKKRVLNTLLIILFAAGLAGSLSQAGFAQSTGSKGHVVIPASNLPKGKQEGRQAHTNVRAFVPTEPPKRAARTLSAQTSGGQPPFQGVFYETPASLACVYQLVQPAAGCNPSKALSNATGGSRAIAVVDAFDNPNAANDLAQFSSQFGLPPADFQVIYAAGTQPANDPGWELEESLDVQMAHALAPNAKLYLVEAASNYGQDLLTAVQVASQLVASAGGGEVSMSWSFWDFDGENFFDSYFATPGVVYFASTGDSSGPGYPSTSPNVIAVGGTALRRNPDTGDFLSEVAWPSTGGGLTFNEVTPSYQSGLAGILQGGRGVPDVAAVADPDTGVWIYDTGNAQAYGVAGTPWIIVGGTSAATPLMAAIVNAAGNFAGSTAQELSMIYGNTAASNNFRDIQQGFCGYYMQDTAKTGWDFCTGVGSPLGLKQK